MMLRIFGLPLFHYYGCLYCEGIELLFDSIFLNVVRSGLEMWTIVMGFFATVLHRNNYT